MNCSEVRRVLYPTPEQAIATIETPAAMDHVRDCHYCEAFFGQQRLASKDLRTKGGTDRTPDALRERIAHLVEEHRSRSISTRRKVLPAVAAIVVAAVLG